MKDQLREKQHEDGIEIISAHYKVQIDKKLELIWDLQHQSSNKNEGNKNVSKCESNMNNRNNNTSTLASCQYLRNQSLCHLSSQVLENELSSSQLVQNESNFKQSEACNYVKDDSDNK